MALFRVGPLPQGAIEAAAEFHAEVLPRILRLLDPPPEGEGDHAQHGGGGLPSAGGDTPPSGAAHLPPPLPGEDRDLLLLFPPAPFDHRGWRLAVVQDLARAAAPVRVNAIVGDDEAAIAETLAYLEGAPGVTGQLLAVEPN